MALLEKEGSQIDGSHSQLNTQGSSESSWHANVPNYMRVELHGEPLNLRPPLKKATTVVSAWLARFPSVLCPQTAHVELA